MDYWQLSLLRNLIRFQQRIDAIFVSLNLRIDIYIWHLLETKKYRIGDKDDIYAHLPD